MGEGGRVGEEKERKERVGKCEDWRWRNRRTRKKRNRERRRVKNKRTNGQTKT